MKVGAVEGDIQCVGGVAQASCHLDDIHVVVGLNEHGVDICIFDVDSLFVAGSRQESNYVIGQTLVLG